MLIGTCYLLNLYSLITLVILYLNKMVYREKMQQIHESTYSQMTVQMLETAMSWLEMFDQKIKKAIQRPCQLQANRERKPQLTIY